MVIFGQKFTIARKPSKCSLWDKHIRNQWSFLHKGYHFGCFCPFLWPQTRQLSTYGHFGQNWPNIDHYWVPCTETAFLPHIFEISVKNRFRRTTLEFLRKFVAPSSTTARSNTSKLLFLIDLMKSTIVYRVSQKKRPAHFRSDMGIIFDTIGKTNSSLAKVRSDVQFRSVVFVL